MKLPNDLIKATDYSNAKDREIHEFEYRNGKYIHKYVLGGEHELTPQEVVDCLNAISTIDCDLQTAYAFIQGQKDKINSLENNIIDDETLNMLVKEHKLYKDLEAKLAEKEHTINTLIEDHKASQEWYKMQLADTEAQNKRVLEKLDIIVRSNQELEKQHDIDNQVIQLMEDNREKDKISFAVEQLEKVKELLLSKAIQITGTSVDGVRLYSINEIFSNQIKQLKEMK